MALLTLALGIGATTAIFSVIKAVVLNPLPYDAPERIAVLWEVNPEGSWTASSVPTFEDWGREVRSLSRRWPRIARWTSRMPAAATRMQRARRAGHARACSRVLRAQAQLGRTFVADEAVVGADRVVVLSHGFWTRVLGANRAGRRHARSSSTPCRSRSSA